MNSHHSSFSTMRLLFILITFALTDAGPAQPTNPSDTQQPPTEATLAVQGVPNPPRITNLSCNNPHVKIEWMSTGDRGAPIQSYRIQFKTNFVDVREKNMIETPENWLTVRMAPWTSYSFRVIAENKNGLSEPSAPSEQCTSPPDVPLRSPENVHGHGTKPNNLVISWTPMTPDEHHGPGFFYKVFWKRYDMPSEPWNHKNISDWKESKLVIENTPTFKQYRIRVEAHNSLGRSFTPASESTGYSGSD